MDAAVKDVVVERDGDVLVVRWEGAGQDGDVEIGIGSTPQAADHDRALTVSSTQRSARIEGFGAGRYYVSVSSADAGATVSAERRVPFQGATNFRDLGGYPTSDGRRTRWGTVFRSDALHQLTDADLGRYGWLGLHAVYDLRGEAERDRYPNPFPSLHLSLLGHVESAPSAAQAELASAADAAAGERVLRELYRGMLANAGPVFGRLLAGLADPQRLPAVFHCTGGKDRTGVSAALLLEFLGVPRDDVLDDYELTARYRQRGQQTESYENLLATGMAPEAAAVVLAAPRWAMAETLQALDEEYGGAEAYLTERAGLQPATLGKLHDLLTD
jgi:protein-tyrosine phosphatase